MLYTSLEIEFFSIYFLIVTFVKIDFNKLHGKSNKNKDIFIYFALVRFIFFNVAFINLLFISVILFFFSVYHESLYHHSFYYGYEPNRFTPIILRSNTPDILQNNYPNDTSYHSNFSIDILMDRHTWQPWT